MVMQFSQTVMYYSRNATQCKKYALNFETALKEKQMILFKLKSKWSYIRRGEDLIRCQAVTIFLTTIADIHWNKYQNALDAFIAIQTNCNKQKRIIIKTTEKLKK